MTRPRSLRPPRRPPLDRRYPIWSVPNITLVSVIVVTLTAALVYLFGHRSLLVETEYVLAVVSASLFTFLAAGLYTGVRVRKNDLPTGRAQPISIGDWSNVDFPIPDVPLVDISYDAEGCLGILFTIIAWIIASIILMILLWLFINATLTVAAALFLALAWIFCRALRQVFRHSRTCRHRLPPSLGYASLYTLLYTGWLFAIVQITHLVLSRHHT